MTYYPPDLVITLVELWAKTDYSIDRTQFHIRKFPIHSILNIPRPISSQMRLLRCVWHGTRKPAGPNCAPTQRPAAIRGCQPKKPLPDCPEEEEEDGEERRKEGEKPNETKGMAKGGGIEMGNWGYF